MQEGGLQDAVIEAAPPEADETVPTLPNKVLGAPATETACGEVDAQVRVTPVSVIPKLSFTVAFTVAVAPALSRNDVVDGGLPATSNEIDCTGQTVNGRGCELTPATLAKIEVVPGSPAAAIC